MFTNKSILITGGTGSFGKQFTKTIRVWWENASSLLEKKKHISSQYISKIKGKLACDVIMDALNELELDEIDGYFPIRLSYYD